MSQRLCPRAPLPGDAVHLGQVLHEVRVINGELRGFPIPSDPSPVVQAILNQGVPDGRIEREMQAILIIRAAHASSELVKRGRAGCEDQVTLLATMFDIDHDLADLLLSAYVQT